MSNLTVAVIDSYNIASSANYAQPVNACFVYSDRYPDLASSTFSKILFGMFYTVTFVFGLVGNMSMLYVTLCNRSMITVQNVFIMNLAVSDIMVCLISVPITPIFLIYKEWYFGAPLCHIIMWVQGSSIFITTYTLMAIAIDRYVLIMHPHRKALSIRATLYITAAIWIGAGAAIFPYAYHMKITRLNFTEPVCGEFCDEDWPSKELQQAFTSIVLVCQYVIPFVVICLCYAMILYRLKTHIRDRLERLSSRQLERLALNKRKRRSTFILAGMVLIFGLCWLPNNIVSMIGNYAPRIFSEYILYFTYLVAHCVAMQSISANPVLYAWLNAAFRKVIFHSLANARYRIACLRWFKKPGRANGNEISLFNEAHIEQCTDYLIRHRRSAYYATNETEACKNCAPPPDYRRATSLHANVVASGHYV